MIFLDAGSVGVLLVVGEGRPGLRGVEGDSVVGVGQRGGAMQGGSGAGRESGPGMRAGRTEVST